MKNIACKYSHFSHLFKYSKNQNTILFSLSSFFIFIILSFSSCKNFLDIAPPKDAAPPSEIFANDAIATSAIIGIYARMANNGIFSGDQYSISTLCGLSADEFKSYDPSFDVFYSNDIPKSDFTVSYFIWAMDYNYIYSANAVIEGLKKSTGVSKNTNKQLEGEAKFIRAFCYFYLVNLFGDAPLNLTTDYRINEKSSRAPREKIYAQIIEDLKDAENLLSSDYITVERIRPNKWAAKALLSRVYLYNESWELAAQKATEVIDQTAIYELIQNLDQVFIKNSKEAIWQLMPPAGSNTNEGSLLVLTSNPTYVSLSPNLLTLFETSDNRKTQWINEYTNSTGTYYYPYKYKLRSVSNGVVGEYSMVIRFAELYLIRAEAKAKLNFTESSLEDINLIRKRAGILIPLIGLNQAQCITELAKQRQLEFFSEWGHRWLDLKRTGKAPQILAPLKGSTWKDTDVLYPIPDAETTRNPNISQNPGY